MDAPNRRGAPASAPGGAAIIPSNIVSATATPRHGITVGLGLNKPQGRFQPLPDWSAQAVADALSNLEGDERWWCGHLFDGDYREESRWQRTGTITVDLDWCDVATPTPAGKNPDKMPAVGWHSALPAEAAEILQAAADASGLAGTLFHLTPRGCRGVLVLSDPCTDAGVYDAAVAAFGARLLTDAAGLGLAHDGTRGLTFDTSATDRARLMFAPRATVKGHARDASVVVMRHELDSAEEWADANPTAAPSAEVVDAGSEGTRAPKALPPVPWDALPHGLGDYGRAVAANMEASEPAIFMAMLVVASAVVPATSEIEGRPGHREKCPLWANVLASPGSRKTDAIDVICQPLADYDQRLEATNQAAKGEWDAHCKALRESAKKGRHPELPPPPSRVQAIIDDYTTESLIDLFIAAEPFGLALLCAPDELSALIGGLNQYKKGGNDRQRLLKIWNGRPYRVDRKGKHARANRPRMGLIAGVQPDVACELHRADTGDGFLDRFAWVDCRAEKKPEYDVPAVPPAARQAWHDAINAHLPIITTADLHGNDQPPPADVDVVVHRLSADAVRLWRDFYNSCDRRPLPAVLKGYAGKVAGQALRVARGLHYLKHGRDAVRVLEVDADTIQAAITIQHWLFAHTVAVRLFMAGGTNVSRPAWLLSAWLVKQPGHRATLRDIYRAGVPGIGNVAAAEAAGNELVKAGVAVWGTSETTAAREVRELILTNQGGA